MTAALLLSFSACSTGPVASQTTTTEEASITAASETTETTPEETTEETTEETHSETTTEETTTEETVTETETVTSSVSTTKPAEENKDTKEFQAFFMSTFTKLAGKKPAKFKPKNPQPSTVYVIVAGDGFSVNNKLKRFENETEEYYSKRFSKSMSSLEELLQNKGKTLYYTSDPNRASVIIIVNRKYAESSRKYIGITAYDCIYNETFINTKTHKQKTFKCRTKPDVVLRVSSYGPYYCSAVLDANDYNDFLEKVRGWFK